MKTFNLEDMIKGWFIGNITPTAFKTNDCEVAFKTYKKGEKHPSHYHKIATEITVFLYGSGRLNDTIYKPNDIIIIEPNVATDFEVFEDTGTIVVKIPGANNDKYEA